MFCFVNIECGKTMATPAGMQQCDDFMQFQVALKEMRLIDDKIVYAINQSIPTTSFKGQSDAKQNCKELHETIKKTYDAREEAVKQCILHTQQKIQRARESGDSSIVRPTQLSNQSFNKTTPILATFVQK